MAISLICLSTLLTWIVRLGVNHQARLWLCDHHRLGLALMAALAVVGGVFPYQQASRWLAVQRDAREAQARRTVLDQSRKVAGIDMPAHTILQLDQPGHDDSFTQADFPQAVTVAGIQARQVFRHVRPGSQTAPPRETWSLALASDQTTQGWTCSRGHRVEFVIEQGEPRFDSCHLAANNTLEGQPLPTGTWLDWRQNGAARWSLSTDGSEPLQIKGMPLLRANVSIDGQGHILSFDGLLAEEFTLGDMTYPAGTRAGSALTAPDAQADDLLFSPPRGRSAKRKGQSDVQSGYSVLQTPSGAVRRVLDNRQAGVLDMAAMPVAAP